MHSQEIQIQEMPTSRVNLLLIKLKYEPKRSFIMQKILIIAFSVILLLVGCKGLNPLNTVLSKTPPYKQYVRSLENANLEKTAMAQAWMDAGEKALKDSIYVTLPFSESGYFKASEPIALSYRFTAREGQVLTANGATVTKGNARFFMDLFALKNNEWVSLAHGDSTFNLTYEFENDVQECLVRIQPELLVTAYYTLNLSLTPVLINPVQGATNKSIGSLYGVSRDGGKRSHEGVDIFAKKGTPVLAPTTGYISRVGTNNLGGKVVWMQDQRRGHSYYFAHLDSQAVTVGTKVKQGDVLGTVGNTGNARYTPAHLHFGIYQSKSKDPINYIRTLEKAVNALPWDTTLTQPEFKVAAKKILLRAGPSQKHKAYATLKKDTYLKVIAHTKDWFRVSLPNDKQGFVLKENVTTIGEGKRMRLKQPTALLSATQSDAVPVTYLEPSTSIEVLAHFETFHYVQTAEGLTGWLVL